MPKLHVDSLTRPSRPAERLAFTQEGQDQELVVWFRRPGPLDRDAAADLAEEKIRLYITGGWSGADGKAQSEPLPFHPVDGEFVELTARSIRFAAQMVHLQCPPDPNDAYILEEFIALTCTMPDAYEEMSLVAMDFLTGARGGQKKTMKPSTEEPADQHLKLDTSTPILQVESSTGLDASQDDLAHSALG